MKKYPVSKFAAGIYVSALFILTLLETALLFGSVPPYDFTHYFLVVTIGIGIVLYLHLFVTDISMARFSFNEEGITMYVGFRKKEHKWSEFMCAGIVAVNLGVKSKTPSDTFWVYFAKTNLTEKESAS